MQPKTDAEWQAESDARTLTEAELIKSDPVRHPKAQNAARILLEQKQKEIEDLKKISGAKIDYSKSMNKDGSLKATVGEKK